MTPDVTIVVIAYNDEDNLPASMRSALGQTHRDIQVVVVDDGSTDGTAQVADGFAATDPRVEVVHLAVNSGRCGRPRNVGLDRAQAPYVTLLDSDDLLTPTACAALLSTARATGADVVVGRCTMHNIETGRERIWAEELFAHSDVVSGVTARPELLDDTIAPSKLYRTAFLDEHNLRFVEDILYEDIVFTTEVYCLARTIAVDPSDVYCYRRHDRPSHRPSITRRRHEIANFRDRLEAHRRVDAFLAAQPSSELRIFKQRRFVNLDLWLYAATLAERDAAYQREFMALAAEHLRSLDEAALRTADPMRRILAFMIRQGDADEAMDVVRHIRFGWYPTRLHRRGDRVFWSARYLDQPMGREALDVTHLGLHELPFGSRPLHNEVTSIHSGDSVLSLSGRVVNQLGALRSDARHKVRLVLRQAGRPGRVVAPVEYTLTADALTWSADVDLGELSPVSPDETPVWNIALAIRQDGETNRSALHCDRIAAEAFVVPLGALGSPAPADRVEVFRRRHARLALRVVRPVATSPDARERAAVPAGAATLLVAVFDAAEAVVAPAVPPGISAVRIDPLAMPPDAVDAHRRTDWSVVVVAARSYAVLRAALPVLLSLGSALEVVVAIDEQPPPGRAAVGALSDPSLPAVTAFAVDSPVAAGTSIRVRFAAAASVRTVVSDLLAGVELHRPAVRSAGLRPALLDWTAAAWTAGDRSARTLANADVTWGRRQSFGPNVVTVGGAGSTGQPAPPHVDVSSRCPPVDVTVVNPHGFRPTGVRDHGEVIATDTAGGLTLRVVGVDGRDHVVLPADGLLSYGELAPLRELTHVDASALHHVPGRVVAGLLTQLAAAAVPTLAGRMRRDVRALLHPELVAALETVDASTVATPLRREVAAVRARRAALRWHGSAAQWRAVRAELGLDSLAQPTVSVLLSTMRVEYVRQALLDIAAQDHPNLEIVVALHGVDVSDEALVAMLEGIERPVVTMRCPSSMPLGEVLNAMTARASGEFVAKMDDDDWYGPHHVTDLLLAADYSSAMLVGTADEYIYLADIDVTIRRLPHSGYDHYAGYVAGPTMLIRRSDLAEVGGWGPTPRAVDRSVVKAVSSSGGGIYRTHGLGFMLCRHGAGHTWNPPNDYFLRSATERWSGFHAAPELDADRARARHDRVLAVRAERLAHR